MKYLDDIEKFVRNSPDIENCGPAKLSSVKLGIACVISDYDYETTKKMAQAYADTLLLWRHDRTVNSADRRGVWLGFTTDKFVKNVLAVYNYLKSEMLLESDSKLIRVIEELHKINRSEEE